MSQDQNPMRRKDVRSDTVLAEIKGLITHTSVRDGVEVQEHEPFIVFNVSDTGLGLWVTSRLERHAIVTVTIAKPWVLVLSCEVRWCRESSSEETGAAGYQVGLKVLDHLQRLESLHSSLAGSTQEEDKNSLTASKSLLSES